MASCFSTLAWKIPWTEEPGGLQSMGSLGVGYDFNACTHIHNKITHITHNTHTHTHTHITKNIQNGEKLLMV